MTPEEIRAEVARRKQRARDLKLRETLWDLEKKCRSYRRWMKDDAKFSKQLIHPAIELTNDGGRFTIGNAAFELTYRKGEVSSDQFGGVDSTTTRGIITLKMNQHSVFEFEVSETITYLPDSPGFDESLGDIDRFIEGAWVNEIPAFVQQISAHEKAAWKERNAPREAREAEELRKKFGI
jgi:hypothetical protein